MVPEEGEDEFDPEDAIAKVEDDEEIERVSEVAEDENFDVLREKLRRERGVELEERRVFRVRTGGSEPAYVHISKGTVENEYTVEVGGVATVVVDEEVVKAGSSFNIFYQPSDDEPADEDYLYVEIAEARGGDVVYEDHREDSIGDIQRDARKFPPDARCRGCRRFSKVADFVGTDIVPIGTCFVGSIAIGGTIGVDVETLLQGGGLAMAAFGFEETDSNPYGEEFGREVRMLCPRIVSAVTMESWGFVKRRLLGGKSVCAWLEFC